MRPVWRPLLSAIALCLLAGCGSGIYPVNGKVVWKDGTPAKQLAGSHVVFESPERKLSARGIIQADGTFKVTTKNDGDGAFPGDYKVFILEDRKNANAEGTQLVPAVMDSRFSDIKTSNLSATVTSGTNDVVLTVEKSSNR